MTVNRVAKSFLQRQFREWYATEVAKLLDENAAGSQVTCAPVDLLTSRMKCIGAVWLIQLYEHLAENPHHMVNGFHAAGIAQSLDAGRPITTGTSSGNDDDDGDDTDEVNDDDDDASDNDEVDSNYSSSNEADDTGNIDNDNEYDSDISTDNDGINLEYDTDEAIIRYGD